MLHLDLINPGAIPDTYPGYDPAEPTIQTEQLSWWLLRTVKQLRDNSAEISVQEDGDYDSTKTAFSTWSNNFGNWITDAISARDAGLPIPDPPLVPDVPDRPGFKGILLSIIIKTIADLVVKKMWKWFNPGTEGGEVAEILRKALLNDGDDSLLDALAAQGLNITFTNEAVYASYSDE